jgi:hypothetical protein
VNTQRLIESLAEIMNKIKGWFEPKNSHPIGFCDSTPNFPNILDISSDYEDPFDALYDEI